MNILTHDLKTGDIIYCNTEVIETENEIIILADPEQNDESHNCDTMGCSSVSHVIFRFRKKDSYQFKQEIIEENKEMLAEIVRGDCKYCKNSNETGSASIKDACADCMHISTKGNRDNWTLQQSTEPEISSDIEKEVGE